MDDRRLLPVVLAVVGCVTIVVGAYQGLVHVAPGYEGTIVSGWGRGLNHEERLLVRLGVLGVVGTAAARWWRYLAGVPILLGATVVFYAVRAVYGLVRGPRFLYREVQIHGAGFGDDPVVFVLGAEPFLLAAGGLLLVGAGITAGRLAPRETSEDVTASTRRE
jgi:hypothetical protein